MLINADQIGLYEECGSECQMVGLPCNGSCSSGTFLCGEVTLMSNFLFLGLRFAPMILNKISTGTAMGSARSFKDMKIRMLILSQIV